MRFIVRMTADGETVTDPISGILSELASRTNGDPSHDVELFLGLADVFGHDLKTNATFVNAVIQGYSGVIDIEKKYKTEEAQDQG
jgi:hypothetical protein